MGRPVRFLVIAQFLTACTDSLLLVVICYLINVIEPSFGLAGSINAVMGLYFLPYLLFGWFGGLSVDLIKGIRVLKLAKFIELAVVGWAAYGILGMGQVPVVLVLSALGLKSALWSVSRAASVPDIVVGDDISRTNGRLCLATLSAFALSVLAAYFVGGEGLRYLGLAAVVLSPIGLIASFFVYAPDAGSDSASNAAPLTAAAAVHRSRGLYQSVLALTYFWAVVPWFLLAALRSVNDPADLSSPVGVAVILVMLAGFALGAWETGVVSEGKVELGLVPLGALAILFGNLLLVFYGHVEWVVFLLIFLVALAGGYYFVPVTSFFQKGVPRKRRGRYGSLYRAISLGGLIISCYVIWYLGRPAIANHWLYAALAVISLIAAIHTIRVLPETMVRCINWIVTHTVYRVKIVGAANVPAHGPALLVCNHVSYIDPSIILGSLERPVRFLMYRPLYEHPVINPIARAVGAIPISSDDDPKAIIRSLVAARDALRNGELVCIFAEGSLSRLGRLVEFKRGLELITRGVDVPIVPLCLDQMWGSVFSYDGGKYFWKRPKELPYPVTLAFGEPLPGDSSTWQVRQAVQELSAGLYDYRHSSAELLHTQFIKTARTHPRRKAIADHEGNALSFGGLLAAVMFCAKRFRTDDRYYGTVGVLLPPSIPAVIANLALMFRGSVPVNINYSAPRDVQESAITQSHIATIITSRVFYDALSFQPGADIVYLEDVMQDMGGLARLQYAMLARWLPMRLLIKMFPEAVVKPHDVATIVFSSGSTGKPKGAVLSHANILSNLSGLYDLFQLRDKDCFIGVLPFFHSFGYTGTFWLPLLSGVKCVFHPRPTDAIAVGELVQQHNATVLLAAPSFLSFYVRRCTEEHFESLRLVVVGAEKLKKHLAKSFEAKFGIAPLEGYGCTELSPVAVMNVPDYEYDDVSQTGHKLGTVGHPIPGVAVRVVNAETYDELGPGQPGLLMVKGANVMRGYLGDLEKTNEVIRGGWYVTGDVASLDDGGFVTIVDRLSRFSKIAGEMVPHVGLEERIQEIVEASEPVCAVAGLPDHRKGERLIVLHTDVVDPEKILTALVDSDVPNLWIPKKEAFFLVDEIPLLGNGKLDIQAVKMQAIRCARGR